MANIGIIGYGVVGKAAGDGFSSKGDNILYYDKFKDSTPLKEVVDKSEFIFICLPTPYKENRIDLTIINGSIEEIANLCKGTDKIIIIKSTIIPGTTKGYAEKYKETNFCFNPEFLTEASPLKDFLNADRTVIGSDDDKVGGRVEELYKKRFPNALIFRTDLTTAELAKYMANSLLATKVIFANEVYDLCEKVGADYNKAKEIVVADKRIGKSHLDITKARGFGGKCFPKDIIAMLGLYEDLEVDASLLKTVWNKNLKIRKKREWDDIPFVNSE